jgi:hypothetical protein
MKATCSRIFSIGLAKCVFCLCFTLAFPAHAKRLALVMGNDNYTAVSKLQKAGNDATAMARELKVAGFTVQLHKDLNYRAMVKAVEAFASSITGGDEVVVFYAGHGVQIKTGSYLLPTDIEASSESEVEKTAYELNALTDKISEAKPSFTLVMVDACRDNPLKSKGRSVGSGRGLSAIEPPKGQMVVYSASRGQQALDRLSDQDSNPNGVFTREFITRMKKPGVKVDDLMREVQDAVENLAQSVRHEQRPAIYNEARGNFYFFSPVLITTTSSTSSQLTAEQKDEKFWEEVKSVGNKEAYQAYLQKFPSGIYTSLAQAYLSSIDKKAQSSNGISNSSTPPSSRPPNPGVLETATKNFLRRYFYDWSADDDKAMKLINEIFSDNVLFYGVNTTKHEIIRQKIAFVKRWPDRKYTERESVTAISCYYEKLVCSIRGIIDWSTASSARDARSRGVSEFELSIDYSSGRAQVIVENGRTLDRAK